VRRGNLEVGEKMVSKLGGSLNEKRREIKNRGSREIGERKKSLKVIMDQILRRTTLHQRGN